MIRSNFRGGGKCCKKEFLWDFVKFPGKHLYSCYARVSFLLRKRFQRKCFAVNLTKFYRSVFLQNTVGRLLSVLLSFTICDQKVLIPSFHLKLIHFSLHKMKKSLMKNFIFCEVCNFANFTTHYTKQCTMNNAFRENSPSHKRLLKLSGLFKQSLQISNLICDYSKF